MLRVIQFDKCEMGMSYFFAGIVIVRVAGSVVAVTRMMSPTLMRPSVRQGRQEVQKGYRER